MKVAVVTTQLFGTPRSGGELCTARLLQALAQEGRELRLIGRGTPAPPGPAGWQVQSLGPLVAPFASLPGRQRLLQLARAWASGRASTVQRLAADGAGAAVRRWLLAQQEQGLDLLVVDHLQAYAWVSAAQARLPPPLVLMHNLESAGYRERAEAAARAGRWLQAAVFRREARLLQVLEQRVLRHAAAVACLSEPDAQAWRALAQARGLRKHVDVLPGFPMEDIVARPPVPAPAGRRRIGLLGTWTWGPNRQALDWMLAQVLPRLPADCELHLAGAGLEPLALPPRVHRLGRVADVAGFYAQVDVVAVPSLQGSGVQEKAIEALALAPAVVATAHALRGLQAEALPQVCIAEGAEAFARACARFEAPASALRVEAARAWAAQRQAAYRQALARCVHAATAAARPAAPGLCRSGEASR